MRTTDHRYEEVVEFVERRHPYEVVPIERFDETDALAAFQRWRRESVSEQ